MLTENDITSFVNRNNLKDSVICLHSSFKSFGNTLNGPFTIIDGFIKNNITLVCPSFYYKSETFPIHENYACNGIDYSGITGLHSNNYTDGIDQIERSMGIIPRLMITCKDAVRTKNPVNSFVILGSKASVLSDGQSLLDVYSVYKKIYSNNIRAFIVLAGVDLTSCTPVHYAEEKAGRTLFRRWALYHGNKVEVEVGSCSEGFNRLSPITETIEITESLGESTVHIFPFNKFIDIVSESIRNNPEITKCDDEKCMRCKDMVQGGRKYGPD